MNQPGTCCRLTPFVLAVVIGASALAGCAPVATTAGSGGRPTMPATSTVPSAPAAAARSKTVNLRGATSLTARVRMTLGALKVSGGAPAGAAMSGVFGGDQGDPDISYSVADGVGDLSVARTNDRSGSLRHTNPAGDWTIALASDVESALSVAVGLAPSDLKLGDMNLKSLEATLGSGASTIDLTGDRITRLDGYIAAGDGSLSLTVPAGKSVRIDVAGPGTGAVTAAGLTKGSDGIYRTASSSGETAEISLRIDRGAGPITLVAK